MKYLNDSVFDIYPEDEAWKIAEEKAKEYLKEYEKAKPLLSSEFLAEYEKSYFHDYEIQTFRPVKTSGTEYNFELALKKDGRIVTVIYHSVDRLKINVKIDGTLRMFDILDSEILPAGGGKLSHEFTVSSSEGGSMHIICKSITAEITSDK